MSQSEPPFGSVKKLQIKLQISAEIRRYYGRKKSAAVPQQPSRVLEELENIRK